MSMNGPDVPIIGRRMQVPITETVIIAPNSIELRAGGLDCGDSIAYLAIIDPLKQRATRVPLNQVQVDALFTQCIPHVTEPHDILVQEADNHGID